LGNATKLKNVVFVQLKRDILRCPFLHDVTYKKSINLSDVREEEAGC